MEGGWDFYALRPASHRLTYPFPHIHENCYFYPNCHKDEDSHFNSFTHTDPNIDPD